jgi:hypothetical protein
VLSAILALGVVAAGVEVAGPTTCPEPGEVVDVLRSLAPDDLAARERALLTPARGGGVRIELYTLAGALLGARELDPAPCSDLARAAAVVIATWETELHPEAMSSVPLPRHGPGPRFELAAAALGSLALPGAGLAPGGEMTLIVAPRHHRLGVRVGVTGTALRTVALPSASGDAVYTRVGLWVGPDVRLRAGRLRCDLHADLGAALLYLGGRGFNPDRDTFDVDPGAGGGARLGVRAGKLIPFLGVEVVGWLRDQVASATGVSQSAHLPRVELLLTLGLALGRE